VLGHNTDSTKWAKAPVHQSPTTDHQNETHWAHQQKGHLCLDGILSRPFYLESIKYRMSMLPNVD
jgi:hypothetical protein